MNAPIKTLAIALRDFFIFNSFVNIKNCWPVSLNDGNTISFT